MGEKNESLNPILDDLRDTHDIAALDLAKNQVVQVVSSAGNQTEPAVSGQVVVWQDNSHACPTCEQDILGKDLASGKSFAVATGPKDQSHPAIDGRNVAWIEFDGSTEKLMLANLDAEKASLELDSVSTDAGTTLDRPAISQEYVAWSEMTTPRSDTQAKIAPHTVLKVYSLRDGTTASVTETPSSILDYALSDHRVIWSDRYLHLLDLATGQRNDLFGIAGASPFIRGNYVLWSATSGDDANGLDIWGLNFNDKSATPTLLVSGPGDQLGAVVADGKLAWSSEGGPVDHLNRVDTADVAALFAAPVAQPELVGDPPAPRMKEPGSTPKAESGMASIMAVSHPLIKGMHAANGNGWNVPAPRQSAATNALVNTSTNEAYFGAVAALESDLSAYTTQAPGAWGPYVANAMKSLVTLSGVQVIIRSNSTSNFPWVSNGPNQSGTSSPYVRADQIINDLTWRSWMRRIQVENEPDTEWGVCHNCFWRDPSGNASGLYTWDNTQDYRLYQTISDWYWGIRTVIQNNMNGCNPATTACSYLRNNQTFWTPPLNPGVGYKLLDNGLSRYKYLPAMLSAFKCGYVIDSTKNCVSYHLYPSPNHKDTTYGWGIRNNTYDWFNATWKNGINAGTIRSQITEFGWDPGAMETCHYTHDSIWQNNDNQACNSAEGAPHRFAYTPDDPPYYYPGDIYTIQKYHTHKAETIIVWITRGWSNAADGLDGSGVARDWFTKYQQSTPPDPDPTCCP